MITMSIRDHEGKPAVMLVLEPGNFTRLREGKPIVLELRPLLFQQLQVDVSLIIEFTPDVPWLFDQFKDRPEMAPSEFSELLEASRLRPDLADRPHQAPVVVDNTVKKAGIN